MLARRFLGILITGGVTGWLVLGCSDRQPAEPTIRAAAGGGSGGISVTATTPDSATQDTTLDVVVSGSGFDQGSSAQWALAGVPTPKVHTNSTTYVSAKKLVANITISADADTGLYDVVVTASTGKKGIGSELFAIEMHKNASADPAIAFSGLTVVDADGSNQTTLLSGGLPSWAPYGDGTVMDPYSMVFEPSPCEMARVDVVVNGAAVQAANPQTFPKPPLATSACHPSWSPAGNEIAFGEGSVNCPNNDCPRPSSLWIMPADPTRASVAVAIYDAPFNVSVYWPTWSSGADHLAIVEGTPTDQWTIRVVDRSSGASWVVVDQTQFSFIRSLDWARTKNAIAFYAIPFNGRSGVYILDLDATMHASGAPRQVLRGASDPSWSPDDTRLVLVAGGIKILDLRTGKLSIGLGTGTFPDWRR